MTARTRVLQLLYAENPGISQIQKEIAASLPETEFEVVTAFLTGTAPVNQDSTRKYLYFNFPKKETRGLGLKVLIHLYQFLKKEHFDVIITHRFKPLHFIFKLNKIIKTPHCIAVIHSFSEFQRSYRRFVLRLYADSRWHFVGVSTPISNHMRNISNGIISKQVITINNAINCTETIQNILSQKQSRLELKLPENAFVFGTIGRLTRSKGQYDLLQAFHQIHLEIPNSILLIIGGGQDEDKLRNYVDAHKLQDHVVLTGTIPDAYRYEKAFDVFILPSHAEAFGISLLEAMAAKIPIIASDVGGIPAVLGKYGKLVPPQNIDSLASAMKEYALLDNNEYLAISNALHDRLLKHFDTTLFHKKYKALICYPDSPFQEL